MNLFRTVRARAEQREGSADKPKALIPPKHDTAAHAALSDDRVLAARLHLFFIARRSMNALPPLTTFWTLRTAFLTGSAAAGGIALINSIGNLGGFVGPYAIGWIRTLRVLPRWDWRHFQPVTCWQARSPHCLVTRREWSWLQVLLRRAPQ